MSENPVRQGNSSQPSLSDFGELWAFCQTCVWHGPLVPGTLQCPTCVYGSSGQPERPPGGSSRTPFPAGTPAPAPSPPFPAEASSIRRPQTAFHTVNTGQGVRGPPSAAQFHQKQPVAKPKFSWRSFGCYSCKQGGPLALVVDDFLCKPCFDERMGRSPYEQPTQSLLVRNAIAAMKSKHPPPRNQPIPSATSPGAAGSPRQQTSSRDLSPRQTSASRNPLRSVVFAGIDSRRQRSPRAGTQSSTGISKRAENARVLSIAAPPSMSPRPLPAAPPVRPGSTLPRAPLPMPSLPMPSLPMSSVQSPTAAVPSLPMSHLPMPTLPSESHRQLRADKPATRVRSASSDRQAHGEGQNRSRPTKPSDDAFDKIWNSLRTDQRAYKCNFQDCQDSYVRKIPADLQQEWSLVGLQRPQQQHWVCELHMRSMWETRSERERRQPCARCGIRKRKGLFTGESSRRDWYRTIIYNECVGCRRISQDEEGKGQKSQKGRKRMS